MRVVVYIPGPDGEGQWMRQATRFIQEQDLAIAGVVVEKDGTGWASATAMVAAGDADRVLVCTRPHVPGDVVLVADEFVPAGASPSRYRRTGRVRPGDRFTEVRTGRGYR